MFSATLSKSSHLRAAIARTRHQLLVARLLRDRGEPCSGLSALIRQQSPVLAPGCYDALIARLVEEEGIELEDGEAVEL